MTSREIYFAVALSSVSSWDAGESVGRERVSFRVSRIFLLSKRFSRATNTVIVEIRRRVIAMELLFSADGRDYEFFGV